MKFTLLLFTGVSAYEMTNTEVSNLDKLIMNAE